MSSSEDQSRGKSTDVELTQLRTLIHETKSRFNDNEHAELWEKLEAVYDQLRDFYYFSEILADDITVRCYY